MIKELQLRLSPECAATDGLLRRAVASESAIDERSIHAMRILRRSIDARGRSVMVNLSLRVYINEEPQDEPFERTEYSDVSDKQSVIVVGAGPGGLFAALRLIELGLRPIVLERGKDVRSRKKDIARISREHIVDAESNYSFGEGGAGAYSDGKLFTRSKKRGNVQKILNVFCQHGASTDILIDAHPHIGTDRLPRVIENMRNTIISHGGEVHFQTRVTNLTVDGGKVVGVEAEDSSAQAEGGGVRSCTFSGPVILATGHSARDIYYMFARNRWAIEPKGIAVGVRLEHPSELIDKIQYHSREGRGRWLPAAEYAFVHQIGGRGVYSFCMCPGGFVVPAASGPEQVVVNGMSPSGRNSRWSNSGMVVEVRTEDVREESEYPVLKMMEFQQRLEKMAWQEGGRRQTAPAQRMADFVNGRLGSSLPVSSYAPGLVPSPLHFWLPDFISTRLREGFRVFGRRSHGFLTNEACLIGVETRTSAPCRILRNDDNLCHLDLEGLYPCGEGAGYAGGIVSAAIDGERCAEALANAVCVGSH
ncbi:MAG: FAD-binding protein [Bacteroidaceae bacterium]|nr:FAD-binding protein [Bacteroidaceae bacterium]